MKKEFVQDFTAGSIPKKLLRFSVPFMLSNAMQVLYSLVDMLVVGQMVGSDGLSAVTIASGVFVFMAMFALGFCNAGQIYIAQLIGAGRRDRLGEAVGTLFTLLLMMGAVMTVLGLSLCETVLRVMNTPAEAYAMARDYMLICSGGVLFTYGYNMVSAVLRGMGDSRHPFIFIMIASVLNIVLDILFVGPCGMGAGGAALATILGQAVSFLYAIVFLFRRRAQFGFDFKRSSFRLHRSVLRVLTELGIPLMLSNCAISFSMMFVNSLINNAGVQASAAFGVGLKLDDIVNRVTGGIGMGVSSVVGQNFAAGEHRRVQKTVYSSWLMTVVVYAVFGVLFVLFSREMFGVFTDDMGVIELGPVFVSAMIWSFPANVIMRGTSGFVQGIGNAKLSFWIALLDGLVFRIGLSWLFGRFFGIWGYFFGFGAAAYGTAIPAMLYFFFGRWRERHVLSI